MHAQCRRRGRYLHLLYLVGIWFKGIDGVLEIIGGVLLLVVSKIALQRLVSLLTGFDLDGDWDDWIVLRLRQAANNFSSSTKIFAGAYLLGHGVVKAGLVWGGLIREKLWAFPTALFLLAGFMVYQGYRLIHHFSWVLAALTLIDLCVFLLIWREFRSVREPNGFDRG